MNVWKIDKARVLMGNGEPRVVGRKGDLCVVVEPPARPAGMCARWVTDLDPIRDVVLFGEPGTGEWEFVQDHRKDTLWSAYRQQYTIDAEVSGQRYDGLGSVPEWLFAVEPEIPLAAARVGQIATLTADCAAAITAGFKSSGLGSEYTYPSSLTDQSNQQSAASNPAGGSLWCKNAGGAWALVAHTQAQASAVLESFVAWLNSCQAKLATLTAQVNVADPVAAVRTFVWDSGGEEA